MAATSLGKPGVVRSMPRWTHSRLLAGAKRQALRRAASRGIPIACGIDVVEIRRFRSLLNLRRERFLEVVFTRNELLDCDSRPERLGARFAAKEAVAKALGCGIGPVGWRELETRLDHRGRPYVRLHGRAARMARARGLVTWSLTLTHTGAVAAACVVAAGRQPSLGAATARRRG